jgi:hypothetical protein
VKITVYGITHVRRKVGMSLIYIYPEDTINSEGKGLLGTLPSLFTELYLLNVDFD